MKRILTNTYFLIVIIPALLFPFRSACAETDVSYVTVRVISDVNAIQPGVPFRIGVHYVFKPGWYMYWKNPGDTGLAPNINWTVPDGFETGELQWPVPQREADQDITSYVYKPDILLVTGIIPPNNLEPESEVTFSADLDWLLCNEMCVRGHAEKTLTLIVRPKAEPAAPDITTLFSDAQKRIPKQSDGWIITAEASDDMLLLEFAKPERIDDMIDESIRFFPVTPMVIDDSAEQKVLTSGKSIRLQIPLHPLGLDVPDSVTGVLAWSSSGLSGRESHAIHFQTSLRPGSTSNAREN